MKPAKAPWAEQAVVGENEEEDEGEEEEILVVVGSKETQLSTSEDALRAIAEKIGRRGRCIDLFRAIDKSNDGSISTEELNQAIQALGVELEDTELELLMDMFDPGRTGDKDFGREVARVQKKYAPPAQTAALRAADAARSTAALRAAGDDKGEGWKPKIRLSVMNGADEACWKMKCHLTKFKTRNQDLHRAIDHENRGAVTVPQLYKGLCQMGSPLTNDEFESIVQSLKPDDEGQVQVEAFDGALKVATLKAKAEGRTDNSRLASKSTWASSTSAHSGGSVSNSFDWSTRSIALGCPLISKSSFAPASAGPLHDAMTRPIHCGHLQDSSVGRFRFFDSSEPPLHLPPCGPGRGGCHTAR
eukprot:CAMPEP_0206537468 /NCGR_PEP_ID=MMETSP0325_2-20121206/7332_1 /ASSEMBLY_ACC=CAM_ASM_000347 /TAXON_ID=2866 /ORGANISM="Crypthecodinium cohnii, Strain Seligo" /LENGTH=359 /DNA_ID=CAMNT_0054034815 /DNA_START=177 /DNA_END=1252 /DNA_ORIENTATION=-